MRWSQLSLAFLPFLLPAVSNAQGGLGEFCTALDGTYTGSNPSCLSGFCRSGTCSDPSNVVDVGQPCTVNNECANAEAADQPPFCSARPGDLALICGGTSSSCYASDGSGTGASPVCASGQCRGYQCTATDAVAPGGSCTANYDCALSRDFCSNGICTDVGTSCTASDGSEKACAPHHLGAVRGGRLSASSRSAEYNTRSTIAIETMNVHALTYLMNQHNRLTIFILDHSLSSHFFH
ncbi:hypothetical protein QFC21_005123 [Naganishia friedmannii]|uniref:Uncharacterized protein n=1 Tax=Naganishia friedmannii TaxID=89922 RepID=A0ACC2VBU1_9TREE|nr:hypothetical protein QFC21_005123 [Naganishia friedmannii]